MTTFHTATFQGSHAGRRYTVEFHRDDADETRWRADLWLDGVHKTAKTTRADKPCMTHVRQLLTTYFPKPSKR